MKNLLYYRVGGAVRDMLLQASDPQISIHETDYVVVNSTPQQLLQLGFQQVGKDFPVFLHPTTKDEFALARLEKKIGTGYHGFTVDANKNVTLEQDLYRRDLTINAIAEAQNGKLIDPYNGKQDINNKTLRHISEHFVEDPLRVLRVARFYARFAYLGFTIADETLSLMQQIVINGELETLPAERVWQETKRALATKTPHLYFQTLRKINALKIWFPELDNLFGVPQPANWHPEIDSGIHTLLVLEQVAKLTTDVNTRFAAIAHDLGKATTPKHILPSHHGHEERGVKLTETLCNRLKAPAQLREMAKLASRWHTHIHRIQQLKPETILKVLNALDAARRPQRYQQLLIISEADSRGRTGLAYKPYPQRQHWLTLANILSKIKPDTENQTAKSIQAQLTERKKQAIKDYLKTIKTS